MKKTILALAVPALLAAGAANASISLYEEDGTKVEFSGVAEVQYRLSGAENASPESGATTDDGQIRVDDGDLAVRITHSEDGVNYAFGALELAVGEDTSNAASDGSGTGDVVNDGLYVGLGGNWGEVSFGRQAAIIDDIGISTEVELKDQAGIDFEDTDFDQLIKYRYNADGYWFGASYNVSQDSTNGTSSQELFEVAAGYNITDELEIRAFYGDVDALTTEFDPTVGGIKQTDTVVISDGTGWDVELAYNSGPFYVGALYARFENTATTFGTDASDNINTSGTSSDTETDFYELAGSYQIGKGKIAAGFAIEEIDETDYTGTSVYLNYQYNLLTNCKVYTEVGFEDADYAGTSNDWDGVGYVAGIEVKF